MNREKVEKSRAWAETVNTGIRDDEPGAFLVRCVLNVLDQLIEGILADEPKPDYYDDGTPGEYGDEPGPRPWRDPVEVVRELRREFGYIFDKIDPDNPMGDPDDARCVWTERDEDDGAMFSTLCGGRVEAAPGLQAYCHLCGRRIMTDPVDHTRTTNPDGTRTPTDEKLVPIGEGPITSPFTSDRNPDGTRTPKGSGHVTLDELDAEIEPAGPVVNENTTTLETAGYGPEAIKSIERGLSQTDTVSRGSFAQYAVPTPDEVTEALRYVDRGEETPQNLRKERTLAATVRALAKCPWSSETNAIARAVRAHP